MYFSEISRFLTSRKYVFTSFQSYMTQPFTTIPFPTSIPIGELAVGSTTWTDAIATSYSKEKIIYQLLGNAHASYTFLWIWPEKILNRHVLKLHTPITQIIDGVLPPNYRMDRGKPLLHIRLGMMLQISIIGNTVFRRTIKVIVTLKACCFIWLVSPTSIVGRGIRLPLPIIEWTEASLFCISIQTWSCQIFIILNIVFRRTIKSHINYNCLLFYLVSLPSIYRWVGN